MLDRSRSVRPLFAAVQFPTNMTGPPGSPDGVSGSYSDGGGDCLGVRDMRPPGEEAGRLEPKGELNESAVRAQEDASIEKSEKKLSLTDTNAMVLRELNKGGDSGTL